MGYRVVVITEEAHTQRDVPKPSPAREVFAGSFQEVESFVAKLEDAGVEAMLVVLSRQHGFLGAADPIMPYDTRAARWGDTEPPGLLRVATETARADSLLLLLSHPYMEWMHRTKSLKSILQVCQGTVFVVGGSDTMLLLKHQYNLGDRLRAYGRSGVARIGTRHQEAIFSQISAAKHPVSNS